MAAFCAQLDLPGTPYSTARKAKEFILEAIRERVTAKKAEFESGRVKKDTLLSFFASAKAEDGEPLDVHDLSVGALCMLLFWRSEALVSCLGYLVFVVVSAGFGNVVNYSSCVHAS